LDEAYEAFVAACEWQDWDEPEIRSCLRTALEAALSVRAEPVAVKPLEWANEVNEGEFFAIEAQTIVTVYFISRPTFDGDFHVSSADGVDAYYSILAEAKAFAQADYEQRIRSALVASPAEPVAWMGHWPGAGSSLLTRSRERMVWWKTEGAEITPLYDR